MLDYIKKWRWGILSLILLGLIILEFYQSNTGQPVDWLELITYFLFCIAIGILGNILIRVSQKQALDNRLLESKYKLSLLMTSLTEWDEFSAELAQFPVEIVPIDQSCLLMSNPISQQYEAVASWVASKEMMPDSHVDKIGPDYLEALTDETQTLWHYTASAATASTNQRDYYCWPIRQHGNLVAFIQFRLILGQTLSEADKVILENISTDVATALSASRDHNHLSEMRNTDMELREQHNATKLLHQQIRQNIEHLHGRLDQLNSDSDSQLEAVRAEIAQLKQTSDSLYEAVHPKTHSQPDTPQLNGLLHEHARKVAQRAGIILTFKAEGRQLPIESETQKVIASVFQETLTNIEKHAKATKVSVFVGWAFDILTVSVTDNGVGFSTNGRSGSNHFGLERMNERITALGGQIDLRSKTGEGSTVTFIIPNLSERLRASA